MEARRYRLVARHLHPPRIAATIRVSRASVDGLLAGQVRFLSLKQAERFESLCSKRTATWLRDSPRHLGLSTGELPVELILPVILDGFDRYGQEGAAGICGVTVRSLFRLLTDSTAISFTLADRIVTGIEGAAWWREEPERLGWYYSRCLRQ